MSQRSPAESAFARSGYCCCEAMANCVDSLNKRWFLHGGGGVASVIQSKQIKKKTFTDNQLGSKALRDIGNFNGCRNALCKNAR